MHTHGGIGIEEEQGHRKRKRLQINVTTGKSACGNGNNQRNQAHECMSPWDADGEPLEPLASTRGGGPKTSMSGALYLAEPG